MSKQSSHSSPKEQPSHFTAPLLRPQIARGIADWAFVVLPKEVSDTLPRRGRTSVDGTIAGLPFRATLEPDGQLSHWLRVDAEMLKTLGARHGDPVEVTVSPVASEREPVLPNDFARALCDSVEASATWKRTSTLARVDWVHWVDSAKLAKTRAKRIQDACEMLTSGKLRVCCFDPSGF